MTSKNIINLYSRKETKEKTIEFNKLFSGLEHQAKKQAFGEKKCFICGKEVRFCNSHSLPRFVLKHIAQSGMVANSMCMAENTILAAETGINNTGTFYLICADCDSREFADYENPDNYNDKPTQIMLSQIAQKSYLKEIYKQTKNIELHNLVCQIYNIKIGNLKELAILDKADYTKQYLYAKNSKDPYFLFYYKCLPYTVPMAAQTRVALISGFNGEIINNVYDLNLNALLEDLHICVFPMKAKSIVMMFVRNGQKRLRPFYIDFLKMSEDQQLQVLTYIILSYSEEVFFSKNLINQINDLSKLGYVCGQTSMFNGYKNDVKECIRELAQDYNLSNAKNIPNLLSAAYAVKND